MNKIIFVLLITFTQNGFAIIHNRTSNFIDIEFETNKLFFECSHHPENDTSYLAFEFIENENYYFFNYRKPLSIKLCNEAMLEYKKIIKDAKTVRIVGISPDYEPMKNIKNLTYPKPFKAKNFISYTFVRLHANNKCKAYFSDDCNLPENYWAGTIPPPAAK